MSIPAYTEKRPTAVFDTECLQNYWSIGFQCVETKRTKVFEKFNDSPLNREGIAKIIRNWRIVGFNSWRYDLQMIALAMSGADNALLKKASDLLILTDMMPWEFRDRFDVSLPNFLDHIDLWNVSPGVPTRPSLKLYAGRMHSRKMQDMPVHHDEWVTEDETLPIIRGYHGNDLEVNMDMYFELKSQLDLRAMMSVQYGVDLRSKSDAQMAEAIFKSEFEKRRGTKIYPPDQKAQIFNYKAPAYIAFKTRQLQDALELIETTPFRVTNAGIVELPEVIDKLLISIGTSNYHMGIGGIHSTEKSVYYESNDEAELVDTDAASYYPYLILASGLVPKQLGVEFLNIYRGIVERRVQNKNKATALIEEGKKAEAQVFKDIAETLKILVNGTFGKLGDPFSVLFSPNLMIQVTLTGQLSLLMLIEELELNGVPVISANTDGFVSYVPHHLRDRFFALRFDWEDVTGLVTEEKAYKGLYSRDVNNYIAIPKKGDVKLKGAYGQAGRGQPGAAGLKKNPDGEIAIKAVVEFLKDGTPIEETIKACDDIRQFLCVKRVNGGAEKDGKYIGKAIRWYYSTEAIGTLNRVDNGNRVPDTEGARPLMELVEELPDDVDYDWYIREAYAILQDIGYSRVDPALRGRTGVVLARMPDSKNIHSLNLATGKAACGAQPKSLRDAWIEYRQMPDGHRFCPKCKKADDL